MRDWLSAAEIWAPKVFLCAFAVLAGLLSSAGCEKVIIDHGHHRRCCPDGHCYPCPDGHCPCARSQASFGKGLKPQAFAWATAGQEVPAMDLPLQLRQHNWGGGSCVHASTVMCLRWQQQFAWADYWRETYSGGESLGGLTNKLDSNGLRYAFTDSGDPAFLDWATRTRRGAVIFYFPNHSICFVGHHLTAAGDEAWLLDNNREDHFLQVPWNEFVKNWKGYGGVALTPIYVPPPPVFFVAGR